MGKTASELLEQARVLTEQAKQIQEASALKIGKHVMANLDKLTIADLINYVREVTGDGTGSEKKDTKTKKEDKKLEVKHE